MLLDHNTTLGSYQRTLLKLRMQRDSHSCAHKRSFIQADMETTREAMIWELRKRFGGNCDDHTLERAARHGVIVPRLDC